MKLIIIKLYGITPIAGSIPGENNSALQTLERIENIAADAAIVINIDGNKFIKNCNKYESKYLPKYVEETFISTGLPFATLNVIEIIINIKKMLIINETDCITGI